MATPTPSSQPRPAATRTAAPTAVPWLLPNPTDDPAIPAALDSPDARARGVLVIRLSPASSTALHLAQDTSRALGIAEGVPGVAGNVDEQLAQYVLYRLCGLGIAALVIDCPHPLVAAQLRCAQRWCDHLRARLVLITRDGEWVGRPQLATSVDEIRDGFLKPRDDERAADWSPDLTRITLPSHEFTSFRGSCHRLLPDHAKAIDDVYLQAFGEVRRHRSYENHHAGEITVAKTAVYHALTLDNPRPPVRLIRLRAVQAALFTHYRVLLRWAPVTPPHQPETSLPGRSVPPVTTLNEILDPAEAVEYLLTGLFELSWTDLRTLTSDNVLLDDDYRLDIGLIHSPALVGGHLALRMPRWARPVLAAYRCARDHHHAAGAPTGSQYLPDRTPDRWYTLRAQRGPSYRQVQAIRQASSAYESSPAGGDILHSWMSRRHLTVVPLAAPPAAPSAWTPRADGEDQP